MSRVLPAFGGRGSGKLFFLREADSPSTTEAF